MEICVPYEVGFPGRFGKNINVAISAIKFTTANHNIADLKPKTVAINVVIGTPIMDPALTPIMTLLTLSVAFSSGTISAATVSDRLIYAG